MTKVRMQGPANCSGFGHDGASYAADENDIIEVPSHIIEHAKAHGFSLITEKAKKLEPLAKAAKGGVADETVSDGGDKIVDGEPDPAEAEKPVKKGVAKAAKGGEQ
jgi:hypothetical protein